MKKTIFLFSLLSIALFSCSKKDSFPAASYELDGVHDISMQNSVDTMESLGLTLLHLTTSSVQETVAITVSGMPSGITISNVGGLSGIPSFGTVLTFWDTSTVTQTAPGTYPITITCKGSSTGTKTYKLNLTVTAAPSYTAGMAGKYNNCNVADPNYSQTSYSDSVYLDPVFTNKIWFTNFGNFGQKVYGYVTSSYGIISINIPQQSSGAYTFYTASNQYNVGPIPIALYITVSTPQLQGGFSIAMNR